MKGDLLSNILSALFLPTILMLLLIIGWPSPNIDTFSSPTSHALDKDSSQYSPSIFNYSHPYLAKAHLQEEVNQYDSAIIYYQQAAVKFEKDSNWLGYMWTNNQIANLYLNVSGNDFTKSKPYLDLAKNAGKYHLKDNHPFFSSTKYYYGLYHYKNNSADSALFYLNDALKDRVEFFGEQTTYVANIYNDIGNVYMIILFDANQAERAFLKSLKILEKVLKPEDPEFVYSFFNLTTISQYKRDFEKASSYSFKTLEKIRQLKVNKADWEELMEGISGDIFKDSGMPEKAKVMYLKAINLSESNNGDLYNRAYYYWRLGEVLLESGSTDSSFSILEKSLKISKSIEQFDYGITASVYLSLGIAASKKGDNRGLYYLSEALNESITFFGKDHIQTANVYRNLGRYWMEKEKLDSALKYIQHAVHLSSKKFDRDSVYAVPVIRTESRDFEILEILRDKADLLKKLYNADSTNTSALKTSLKYYHLIDSLLFRFDAALEREKSKLIFSDFLYNFYEEAIGTCVELNKINPQDTYTESALYFIDKRKAYILFQNIKSESTESESWGDQESEKELMENYYFVQAKIDEETNSGNPDRNLLSALHIKLLGIEKQLASTRRNRDSFDLNPMYSPRELMSQVQEYSKKHNTALLNYFWGDNAIYISGIYLEKKALIVVPLTEELKNNIDSYRSALKNGFRWNQRNEDFVEFCKGSFYVYNHIFKPIFDLFKQSKSKFSNVVIIPDGPLSAVPFDPLISKLPDENKLNYKALEYLVKDLIFSYSYSSKLLVQSKSDRKNKNDKILALGYSDLNLKDNKSNTKQLNELPGAAAEIKAIEKHIEGKFLYGSIATETAFKANVENYEVLHLAVHGKSNEVNTYNSKLIFKKDPTTAEDGDLYPYELYNLNLKKVKLAVLSACESGEGKGYRGEGIYSLARGFIRSGCASVVMSLWRVNDQSSKILMDEFYKELKNGTAIDVSLRLSKLNYLKQANSKNSHPSNWSSFVSIGKTNDTLNFTQTTFLYLFVFLMVLGILIALVRRKRIS